MASLQTDTALLPEHGGCAREALRPQDDSTGRTSDAGLGKMGSIILLVAPDLIFTDPVAVFCISVHGKRQLRDSCYDGISMQQFGHTRFPWSSISVTSVVLLHEAGRSMITSSAKQMTEK